MVVSFKYLLKVDQPEQAYQLWVQATSELPASYLRCVTRVANRTERLQRSIPDRKQKK